MNDLAEKTAANTAVISQNLKRMAENSGRLAEMRARSVAELKAVNLEVGARTQLDIALLEQSAAADAWRFRTLTKWSEKVSRIHENAELGREAYVARVLASRRTLDVPAGTLAEVAQTLSQLATEEGFEEQAKFLADYARAVAKEVAKQRKQSDKAKESAENDANRVADAANSTEL